MEVTGEEISDWNLAFRRSGLVLAISQDCHLSANLISGIVPIELVKKITRRQRNLSYAFEPDIEPIKIKV